MSISDIVVLKQGGVLSCHYVDQYAFSELPGFFSGRNPLRAAEDSLEQNDNQLDGILNNTPSVAELEAQVKAGQQVSLVDLAQAVHKEQTEKKKSVVAQLRTAPPAQEQRKKQRKKHRKGAITMKHFTYEEMELMSIYDPGTREGLIANLEEMRGYLEPDETELRELTDSALEKLRELSDADYEQLELIPDFMD